MTEENTINDYFYRPRVMLNNKRTSVSLDAVLANLMEKKLGSLEKVQSWIQSTVNDIAASANDEKLNAGLSRIVQQKAIMLIADPALKVAG